MLQGYTTIRFEQKDIRLKWDYNPQKYWFVVVDVLSYLVNNPHVFWKEVKKTISTNLEPTSNYYISCTYNNESFDIADYNQIVNILKYIQGRVSKKQRLVMWLKYPIPTAIQNKAFNTLYSKNQTQSDWDNLIKEAYNCGVHTTTIKDYIEYLKNQKQYQAYINNVNNQPTEKKEENNSKSDEIKSFLGCFITIGAVFGLFGSVGLITKYSSTHPEFAWIAAGVFIIVILIGLFIYYNESQYTYVKKNNSNQVKKNQNKPSKQVKSSPEEEIVAIDGKRNCPHCGKTIDITDNRCPFCNKHIVTVTIGNGEIPIKNARSLITSNYHFQPEDETGKTIAVIIWTIIGTAAIIFFYMSIFKSCY